MTHKPNGYRNGQAFVNVDVSDIGESASEKVDKQIWGAGGADSYGSSAEPFKAKPPFADEGAGVAARFGIQAAYDLED